MQQTSKTLERVSGYFLNLIERQVNGFQSDQLFEILLSDLFYGAAAGLIKDQIGELQVDLVRQILNVSVVIKNDAVDVFIPQLRNDKVSGFDGCLTGHDTKLIFVIVLISLALNFNRIELLETTTIGNRNQAHLYSFFKNKLFIDAVVVFEAKNFEGKIIKSLAIQ